jgi:hypothetical protein
MTAKAEPRLSIVGSLQLDPNVKLPVDVEAAVARGETAFKSQARPVEAVPDAKGIPEIITSVADQDLQDGRDANLSARAQKSGRRRQPPMIERSRAVMILVDRLIAEGVPPGVGPNSKMNRAVRTWLNKRAGRSTDPRRSRRKDIGATAVRELLKQIRAEGRPVSRQPPPRRRTIQEEAAERLKALRAQRTSAPD